MLEEIVDDGSQSHPGIDGVRDAATAMDGRVVPVDLETDAIAGHQVGGDAGTPFVDVGVVDVIDPVAVVCLLLEPPHVNEAELILYPSAVFDDKIPGETERHARS